MFYCRGSRGLVIQRIYFHTHKQCSLIVPNRFFFLQQNQPDALISQIYLEINLRN